LLPSADSRFVYILIFRDMDLNSLGPSSYTGTSRPCFICFRESTTVLSSSSTPSSLLLALELTKSSLSPVSFPHHLPHLSYTRLFIFRTNPHGSRLPSFPAFNTTDFLYVCPGHLLDRGFATLLSPPPAPSPPTPSGPSKEEIAKVIADYERKKSKGKEKEKDGDKKDEPAPFLTPAAAPAPPAAPSHPVYELHRDYWALRQSEMKKRDNLVKVSHACFSLFSSSEGRSR